MQIAIDDFGTGYSSLSYLQRVPFDILKIDRAFVAALRHEDPQTTLVRTIMDLGRTLGRTAIAEGIEEQVELDGLLALGCELGQGLHFGQRRRRRPTARGATSTCVPERPVSPPSLRRALAQPQLLGEPRGTAELGGASQLRDRRSVMQREGVGAVGLRCRGRCRCRTPRGSGWGRACRCSRRTRGRSRRRRGRGRASASCGSRCRRGRGRGTRCGSPTARARGRWRWPGRTPPCGRRAAPRTRSAPVTRPRPPRRWRRRRAWPTRPGASVGAAWAFTSSKPITSV